MVKRITILVHDKASADEYAHLANAAWVLMRASQHGVGVEAPDAPASELDRVWSEYAQNNPWPS